MLGKEIGGAIGAVGNILDDLFTSDEEKLDKQVILERLRQRPDLAQAEINKIEAAHRSIFVAGWRPAIGWACAGGVFWAFLGHPVAEWVIAVNGLILTLPTVPTDNIFEMVFALLGMGGLRTYEKIKGKS